MLTVVTWKWAGYRNAYTMRHVVALRNALRATGLEHRFVCITDDPMGDNYHGVETYPIWPALPEGAAHGANCFHRLRLFDPEFGAQFGDEILWMDLDAVILGDLTPIVDFARAQGGFCALAGRVAAYNGSLVYLQPGKAPNLWAQWRGQESGDECRNSGMIGSDQVFMSLRIPCEGYVISRRQGVYQYSALDAVGVMPLDARLVFFAGGVKPWDRRVERSAPLLAHAWACRAPKSSGLPVWTGGPAEEGMWTNNGLVLRVQDDEVQVRGADGAVRSYAL